jgi:uncharacterized membrane protein
MTQNSKAYIIKNLKWPISNLSYISNYFILIVPIALISIAITEYERGNKILGSFLTGLFLLFFIVYRIETERKFTELVLTKDLSTSEIGKILTKNNWSLVNQEDGILEFSTNVSSFSWGEIVTIIKVSKYVILINSQPSGRNPFTLFKDKINYNIIKSILEK